jgi:hypothetical protein
MGSNLREIRIMFSILKFILSSPNTKEKKRIQSKEKVILEFYLTICLWRWGLGIFRVLMRGIIKRKLS